MSSSAAGIMIPVTGANGLHLQDAHHHPPPPLQPAGALQPLERQASAPPALIREQDRFMPIANVIRIMRKVLPTHAKISDDAKETIQECVSEYISFITSEANERCQQEQRKTITAEDVLWAMSKLGFDDYIEPLTVYLQRYREIEGDHRGSTRGENLPLIKRSASAAEIGGGHHHGLYGGGHMQAMPYGYLGHHYHHPAMFGGGLMGDAGSAGGGYYSGGAGNGGGGAGTSAQGGTPVAAPMPLAGPVPPHGIAPGLFDPYGNGGYK